MKNKVLHINYPSLDAYEIGQVTASVRDEILKQFENTQVSFSFSSNKQSGYIMLYPTPPILSLRISNHAPIGGGVDKYAVQAVGNKVTVNAEAEQGQAITESVLYDTLEQVRLQCEAMQAKLIK